MDTLSRPNSQEIQESTKEILLIPPEAFLNVFSIDSDGSLESRIVESQEWHQKTLEEWAKTLPIQELDERMWKDNPEDRLQVTQNEGIYKMMGMFKTTLIKPLHNLI